MICLSVCLWSKRNFFLFTPLFMRLYVFTCIYMYLCISVYMHLHGKYQMRVVLKWRLLSRIRTQSSCYWSHLDPGTPSRDRDWGTVSRGVSWTSSCAISSLDIKKLIQLKLRLRWNFLKNFWSNSENRSEHQSIVQFSRSTNV